MRKNELGGSLYACLSYVLMLCHAVECEDDVPPAQKSLFHGYTFMLTQKPKEDGRSGEKTTM